MKTATSVRNSQSKSEAQTEVRDSLTESLTEKLRGQWQGLTEKRQEQWQEEELLVYDTTQPRDSASGLCPLKAKLHRHKGTTVDLTEKRQEQVQGQTEECRAQGVNLTEKLQEQGQEEEKTASEKKTQDWTGLIIGAGLVLLILILYLIKAIRQ